MQRFTRFIRGSQAVMYFPDDPYYLVDYEYTGTLRLMFWMPAACAIAVLLLSLSSSFLGERERADRSLPVGR